MYLGLGLRFGGSGAIGASIQLSANTVDEAATVGQKVGTLSVVNGTGGYTFALLDDAGGLFVLAADDLNVAATLTEGTETIQVEADNGVDTPTIGNFQITITASVAADGSVNMDEDGNPLALIFF